METEYKNRFSKTKLVFLRALLLYYRDPDFRVIVLIRLATVSNSAFAQKAACKKLMVKYGVFVSKEAKIGKKLIIGHYNGLVIGSGVEIGDNCTLYQQVTIGQNRNHYPKLGNNITVYAGAKIIGGITIGDNCKIGANAVVNKDVPANCTAVGVPARIIQN